MRVFAVSAEGQEMTRVLIAYLDRLVPGGIFEGMAGALLRYLLGDTTADLLAVPPSDWGRALARPLRLLGWWAEGGERGQLVGRMCELFGRMLVEGIVWVGRGNKRPAFHIPETLQASWRVRGPPPSGREGAEHEVMRRSSG